MFLTADELKAMTQASKRTLQEAWLKQHRIPFTEGRQGGLNVLRAYVEQAHGLKAVQMERPSEETEPNLDAFRKPGK